MLVLPDTEAGFRASVPGLAPSCPPRSRGRLVAFTRCPSFCTGRDPASIFYFRLSLPAPAYRLGRHPSTRARGRSWFCSSTPLPGLHRPELSITTSASSATSAPSSLAFGFAALEPDASYM